MTTLRAGLLVLCVTAVEWLAIASNYKDSVFLGTYHLKHGVESSTLTIQTDQTFQQEVTRNGNTQSAHGRWRRTGEGTISFSREFITLTGQELGADGTPYGNLDKAFGLFPSIALAQSHVLWYRRTDASPDSSIAGTYTGDEAGVPTTLILRQEHTFEQTITHAGRTRHARGTWSPSENGDVLFSREFLKTSGEPLTVNETATAAGPKGSTLQIEVGVNPSVAQPVFRKRMLVR